MSVFFIDASNGWAVGTGGTILATTNGGTTWSPQTSGTVEALWSVSFPDTMNGWAVGSRGAVLHYEGASIGDLVWEDTNGNGVQDPGEGGLGIAGVALTLLDGSSNPLATTTTAADGSYLFAGLAAGDYTVVVDAGNFASGGPLEGYSSTTGGNSQGLTLAAGQEALAHDFGYYLPGSIGDLVWEDTNGNGVQNPGESGLANVALTLLDGSSNPLATTTTAADGSYLFAGLAAGDYTVVVDAANFTSGGPLEGYVSTTGGNSQGLTLAAGQQALAQDFGYRLESTPTPTPSPSPSPTSPPASTPTPTPSPDGDSEIGGWLSTTGGALGLLATLGAVLVLAGVSLHRLGRPGKDR